MTWIFESVNRFPVRLNFPSDDFSQIISGLGTPIASQDSVTAWEILAMTCSCGFVVIVGRSGIEQTCHSKYLDYSNSIVKTFMMDKQHEKQLQCQQQGAELISKKHLMVRFYR